MGPHKYTKIPKITIIAKNNENKSRGRHWQIKQSNEREQGMGPHKYNKNTENNNYSKK